MIRSRTIVPRRGALAIMPSLCSSPRAMRTVLRDTS
jgi:hypothetical protein